MRRGLISVFRLFWSLPLGTGRSGNRVSTVGSSSGKKVLTFISVCESESTANRSTFFPEEGVSSGVFGDPTFSSLFGDEEPFSLTYFGVT